MGSAYTALVSHLLFPLHEWIKGHDSVAVRRQLEVTQWWPGDRLRARQLDRLRALLRNAKLYVPYYRALFAEMGLDPEAVEDLSALSDSLS